MNILLDGGINPKMFHGKMKSFPLLDIVSIVVIRLETICLPSPCGICKKL